MNFLSRWSGKTNELDKYNPALHQVITTFSCLDRETTEYYLMLQLSNQFEEVDTLDDPCNCRKNLLPCIRISANEGLICPPMQSL